MIGQERSSDSRTQYTVNVFWGMPDIPNILEGKQ